MKPRCGFGPVSQRDYVTQPSGWHAPRGPTLGTRSRKESSIPKELQRSRSRRGDEALIVWAKRIQSIPSWKRMEPRYLVCYERQLGIVRCIWFLLSKISPTNSDYFI